MSQKIAIFASGSGTNAENIIKYFQDKNDIEIAQVLSNRSDAYVLKRAEKFDIPSDVFSRKDFYESNKVLDILKNDNIDWIILAGFLWLLPQYLLTAFNNKIINIHPSLLPKYGGKGMYGKHVHQAVFDNFERETGVTIHLVDKEYDKGQIIFQESISLKVTDTPDRIAEKIHQLEYTHFPVVIEDFISQS